VTPAEWVVETRREQGLPDHVEELAILVDLARLVIESRDRDG
jgi:hypothetical protein